jgi:hypothetical protein
LLLFSASSPAWSEDVTLDKLSQYERDAAQKLIDGLNTSDEKAYSDALDAFARHDFHVVLAACWHVVDREKLGVRELMAGTHRFTVYVGDFTRRGESSLPDDVIEDALSAIEAAIATAPLTDDVHWIRVFYGLPPQGDAQVEVLLDNEPWAAGHKAVTSVDWPRAESYYSLRNLIALVPAD